MKKSLKRLIENSPTSFFESVKERLVEKATDKIGSVAGAVAPSVFEEVEHVEEDMGAHTIYTRNKKTGQNVATFVVNKKRRGKADIAKKWQELVKKNQPKETAWDKHVKDN